MPNKYTVSNLFNFVNKRKLQDYSPIEEPETESEIIASKKKISYSIFTIQNQDVKEKNTKDVYDCLVDLDLEDTIYWINVNGIKKKDVRRLCSHFNVHNLLVDDILSLGQRAKSDALDDHLFCILPMLRYNMDGKTIEKEQLSIILGKNYVISFQEESLRDPFNPLRKKLRTVSESLRKHSADFLCYSLIDAVVDEYFTVLEELSKRIEMLESKVILSRAQRNVLIELSSLRNELMFMKRSITPVRDLIQTFLLIESNLVDPANNRFYKDIYDHILLAIEYNESYRELTNNLQDLYVNQVNTRMNEVMKVLTVVTVSLAPATIIGGIFGMNFKNMPLLESPIGFGVSIFLMVAIPTIMLIYFKKKGWF